jgi:hypothetical protein
MLAGQTSPILDPSRDAAIAIESIDGLPPSVVQGFVRDLNEEAGARKVAVVPRGGAAPYRLRGYLALHAQGAETSIAWAWDIYDGSGERRTFRLSGEERAARDRNAWTAADDQVLRQIARASIEQLALFISTGRATANLTAVEPLPAVAERGAGLLTTGLFARFDDFRPEAAGIFRLLESEPPPPLVADGRDPAGAVPLPRHRPAPSGPESPMFAYTDPDR